MIFIVESLFLYILYIPFVFEALIMLESRVFRGYLHVAFGQKQHDAVLYKDRLPRHSVFPSGSKILCAKPAGPWEMENHLQKGL